MNEEKISKEELNEEQARVTLIWKDNGQVVAKIVCKPEEVYEIKLLFDFIKKLEI